MKKINISQFKAILERNPYYDTTTVYRNESLYDMDFETVIHLNGKCIAVHKHVNHANEYYGA